MVVRGQGFACEIRWAVREIIALLRIVLLAGLLSGGLAVRSQPLASAPRVSEFAWVGSVAALEPGSLVRIALPPDALTRLQSRAGHDVRVFNAAGDVLPYALTGAQAPVRAERAVQTRAFPLTSLADGALADLRSEVQLLRRWTSKACGRAMHSCTCKWQSLTTCRTGHPCPCAGRCTGSTGPTRR